MDPRLEKLQSDLAFEDALAKLLAEQAAIDDNLKHMGGPGLSPPNAALFYRRYYQREREKVLLRIDLLKLPRTVEQFKREYEIAASVGSRQRHEDRCRRLQAGRAVGRSRNTSLPQYPEVAAKKLLDSELEKLKSAGRRLQELCSHDPEWADLLRTTAQPVRRVTNGRTEPSRQSKTSAVKKKRQRPAKSERFDRLVGVRMIELAAMPAQERNRIIAAEAERAGFGIEMLEASARKRLDQYNYSNPETAIDSLSKAAIAKRLGASRSVTKRFLRAKETYQRSLARS